MEHERTSRERGDGNEERTPVDGERVKAGNAARDPAEQTCREDLPPDHEQETCAEPGRGSRSPAGPGSKLRFDRDEAVRAKGREQPLSEDPARLSED